MTAISFGAAPFSGYGNLFRRESVAVLAFVIFHRREVPRARKALLRARAELGVPPALRLDDRALAVSQSPPGAADDAQARHRLAHLVAALNAIPGMLRYTWIRLDNYPLALDDSAEGIESWRVIRGALQESAFAVPPGGMLGPQAHECEPVIAAPGNRDTHAHGVFLDLAGMLAAACAESLGTDRRPWAAQELERVRFWSHQEIVFRQENRA